MPTEVGGAMLNKKSVFDVGYLNNRFSLFTPPAELSDGEKRMLVEGIVAESFGALVVQPTACPLLHHLTYISS